MGKEHTYRASVSWTGNTGTGTSAYRAYERCHRIHAEGKSDIAGSSDPIFRGDSSCWSPEDLLVAGLSGCHQLWYLHLCADAGVVVTAYEDDASGVMVENADGSGQFVRVLLQPRVTITDASKRELALKLHEAAHEKCFLARSMNFPVEVRPTVVD
jgi:organic hydroperoxide reductase OsmC/OhrA